MNSFFVFVLDSNGKKVLCGYVHHLDESEKDWKIVKCFYPIIGNQISVEKDSSNKLRICNFYADGIPYTGEFIYYFNFH